MIAPHLFCHSWNSGALLLLGCLVRASLVRGCEYAQIWSLGWIEKNRISDFENVPFILWCSIQCWPIPNFSFLEKIKFSWSDRHFYFSIFQYFCLFSSLFYKTLFFYFENVMLIVWCIMQFWSTPCLPFLKILNSCCSVDNLKMSVFCPFRSFRKN